MISDHDDDLLFLEPQSPIQRRCAPIRVQRRYPTVCIQRRCPPCPIESPFVVATLQVPCEPSPFCAKPQLCPPPPCQPYGSSYRSHPNISKKKKLFKCRRNKKSQSNQNSSFQNRCDPQNLNSFPNFDCQQFAFPPQTKKERKKKQKSAFENPNFQSDLCFSQYADCLSNWQQCTFPQQTKSKRNKSQKDLLRNGNCIENGYWPIFDWNFPQPAKPKKKGFFSRLFRSKKNQV